MIADKNIPDTFQSEIKHNDYFEELFRKEYGRLANRNHIYLDYTAGNLYSESQIDKHHKLLKENVFGNPHSTNPTSRFSTKLVEEARKKVLTFFNAGDYHCIFTQNATGALQIVGECYPFSEKSYLLLLADNHNSVNGIREYSSGKNGAYEYCSIQYEDLKIDHVRLEEALLSKNKYPDKLFAFPAQSNVSGVKHDLDWISKAQDSGWDVLLDAAAFVPTSKLDLSETQPDFVPISFYKIFGYPTGLGCLLVKKSKFDKLKKPWFAGGTVTLASVQANNFYLAANHERFENGTINYLDIPAVKIGLDYIESIGIERINERTASLADYLCKQLKDIKHDGGQTIVKIFGPEDRKDIGATMIMSFFDSEGNLYPFELIEEMANKEMISIRSGCFCNPGIDEVNNCITTEDLSKYFSSREKGDYKDMIAYLNKLRGATRVSLGIATRKGDLDIFLQFVNSLKNKKIA